MNTSSHLIESILNEIDKGSNDQTSEMLRLQEELNTCESELMALQIRFTHKTRETEDLKLNLTSKTKQLNEKLSEIETKTERLQWLEFHYEDLLQKYKLCMECMNKLKKENEELNFKIKDLLHDKSKQSNDQSHLKEIFNDKINDLDTNFDKLLDENKEHLMLIDELRKNSERLQIDLDHSIELNKKLAKRSDELENELQKVEAKSKESLACLVNKLSDSETKYKQMEMDTMRMLSKLDETSLQLSEMSANLHDQVKHADSLKMQIKQKDLQHDELKDKYETFLIEYHSAKQNFSNEKNDLEFKLNELNEQNRTNLKLLEDEKNNKQRFEREMQKMNSKFNVQHTLVDDLAYMFKIQTTATRLLKKSLQNLLSKFERFKTNQQVRDDMNKKTKLTIKCLEEKCVDFESRFTSKSEKVNELERELYMTQNSFEDTLKDLANMTSVLSTKSNEIILKNKTIDQMEAIINQQKAEINKHTIELAQRITQMERFEKSLSQEKSSFDAKLRNMEINLKSKSKQLHQRIEQIKDMTEIVSNLKTQREQFEYKLEQYEKLIKCQRLEIESKSSMLRQFELRKQDATNEINNIKSELEEERRRNQSMRFMKLANEPTNLLDQETQTIDRQVNEEEKEKPCETSFEHHQTHNQHDSQIEDLTLQLNIKSKMIDSINEELLTKSAEIARLEAKLDLLSRKNDEELT